MVNKINIPFLIPINNVVCNCIVHVIIIRVYSLAIWDVPSYIFDFSNIILKTIINTRILLQYFKQSL